LFIRIPFCLGRAPMRNFPYHIRGTVWHKGRLRGSLKPAVVHALALKSAHVVYIPRVQIAAWI
jgi:hypothetical protein